MQSWFTQATQAPEIKTRLAALQFSPTIKCGADFAAFLRKRSDDFGRAIRDAKIKAE